MIKGRRREIIYCVRNLIGSALFCILITAMFIKSGSDTLKQKNWQEVEGTVIKAEEPTVKEEYKTYSGTSKTGKRTSGGRYEYVHKQKGSVLYEFNGEAFEKEFSNTKSDYVTDNYELFKVGDKITVFVNPKEPSEASYLGYSEGRLTTIILLVLEIFAAVMLIATSVSAANEIKKIYEEAVKK